MLLGEVISDTNEKTSLGMAQRICSDFMEETQAALRKVRFPMLHGQVSILRLLTMHAVREVLRVSSEQMLYKLYI